MACSPVGLFDTPALNSLFKVLDICPAWLYTSELLSDYSCIVTLYPKVQQVLEYPKAINQESILPEAKYHLNQPVILHISIRMLQG